MVPTLQTLGCPRSGDHSAELTATRPVLIENTGLSMMLP